MYAPRHPRLWLWLSFESACADPVLQGGDWLGNCSTAANPCRVAQEDCKLPGYRCHLGCILLKMAAISLPTGPNGPGNAGNILPGSGRSSWDPITVLLAVRGSVAMHLQETGQGGKAKHVHCAIRSV